MLSAAPLRLRTVVAPRRTPAALSGLVAAPVARRAVRRGGLFTRQAMISLAASGAPRAASGDGRPGNSAGSPTPGGGIPGQRRHGAIRALAGEPLKGSSGTTEPEKKPPATATDVLSVVFERFIRPLRDFGFGRKSIWEGGVGLFIIGGIGARACAAKHPFSCLPDPIFSDHSPPKLAAALQGWWG